MKCVIVTTGDWSKSFPNASFTRDEKGYLQILSEGDGLVVASLEPGWRCAELIDQDNTAGDTP